MPDREKVINEFEKICGYTMRPHEFQVLNDVLTLLKEQEAVEPITEHKLFLCPVCKNTLFREQKFCHECGQAVKWDE